MSTTDSRLRQTPTRGASLYAFLCGTSANPRPWHFQWLSARSLRRGLNAAAPGLTGRVLDVGCGLKPYASLLAAQGVTEHLGLDTSPGDAVDLILPESGMWPVDDESLDGVLCTQVLEFIAEPELLFSEARRCLRSGGRLVLTAPFIYNEHGPVRGMDLERWTTAGLHKITSPHLEVLDARPAGGPASVLGTLLLNGIDSALSGRWRWLKLVALPVLLVFSLAVNATAALADTFVRHPRTYLNVVLVAQRP